MILIKTFRFNAFALISMLATFGAALILFVLDVQSAKSLALEPKDDKSAVPERIFSAKSPEIYRDLNFPLPLPLPEELQSAKVDLSNSVNDQSSNQPSPFQLYLDLVRRVRVGEVKAAYAIFKILEHCAKAQELLIQAKSQSNETWRLGDERLARSNLLSGQCEMFTYAMIDERSRYLDIAVERGDPAAAYDAFMAGPGLNIDSFYDESDPMMTTLRNDPKFAAWAKKTLPFLEKSAFAGNKNALSTLGSIYNPPHSGPLQPNDFYKHVVIELVTATLYNRPNNPHMVWVNSELRRLPLDQ